MKKAFVFTVATIFMMMLILSAVILLNEKTDNSQSINSFLTFKKVETLWDDVSEGVTESYGVQFSKQQNNLSIYDEIPSTYNVSQGAMGYSLFIANYYQSQDANISFNPPLVQAAPTFVIMPFGLIYTYPSGWTKSDLGIISDASNFSVIKNLTIYINSTQYYFNQSFTGQCTGGSADWNSYKNCTERTKYCLFLNLIIVDANNTYFRNTCTPLDLGGKTTTTLQIQFTNYSVPADQNPTVTFQFGKIDKTIKNNYIFKMDTSDNEDQGPVFFEVNTTFTLNTTQFALPSLNNLTVADRTSGIQKSAQIEINTN